MTHKSAIHDAKDAAPDDIVVNGEVRSDLQQTAVYVYYHEYQRSYYAKRVYVHHNDMKNLKLHKKYI